MREYPYWVVVERTGRLRNCVPPHLRHTPIDRMMRTGKIGGKKTVENTHTNFLQACLSAGMAERVRKEVDIYVVEGPRSHRRRLRNWREEERKERSNRGTS